MLIALADDGLDGLVDAALERRGVGSGGDGLDALAEDGLCEHRRCGGAVAGDIRGFGGDLLDELRADVLDRVRELDLLGDSDAVLGDGGGAELLFDDDVAALGSERHLDGVGERVDAAKDCLTGVFTVQDLLCHTLLLESEVVRV